MRFFRSTSILTALVLSAVGATAIYVLPGARAQNPPKLQGEEKPRNRTEELQRFMRRKLDASNRILEGLATEDSRLVKTGAEALSTMCEAEEWRVSKDVMYRQFSNDFQRGTKLLADAAQAGDLDKALVRWMDVTIQCIDCHKFVRDKLIAEPAPKSSDGAK